MEPIVKSLILIGFVIIGGVLVSAGIILRYHETVHQTIFSHYDVSSEIEYSPLFLGGRVNPINATEYNENCNANCKLLQLQTEIVGYHCIALISCLWIMVIVISGSWILLRT